jgi:NADH-quinone oxidoreductase subunit E
MLSEDERRAIEAVVGRLPNRAAGSLEALRVVQERRGWVSDEAVRDVAAALGMSADELDGVATFYSLIFRKPVGRHVILVCDSFACWVMGYENIMDHLKARLSIELGGTTLDGRFTLLVICCIGACDQAPAMIVDGELYGNLTPQRIDEILEKHP